MSPFDGVVPVRGAVSADPLIGQTRFHAISIPRRTYTGDFWFARSIGTTLWFALGDVAGKGAQSAVWMAMIQEELDARIDHSTALPSPAAIVAQLDEVLRAEMPPNRFATLVLGRIEQDGALEIVNAGHCPPLLVRAGGDVERFETNGAPVGILPNRSWSATRGLLVPGDLLVLYSDGLAEARRRDGTELGIAGASELAAAARGESPRAAATLVAERLTRSALIEDDVTLLVLG